eukprot:TRINITY_DN5853_c0_g1_i1.p1 TRINITY_DN5853_c0_g1~~TRINITY_DN5853_c0_g1_i1.p1  ORF type:complete len:186 (+),score=23.43 TRINITY_DN5853_c0_g1_i1:651-1208(+)
MGNVCAGSLSSEDLVRVEQETQDAFRENILELQNKMDGEIGKVEGKIGKLEGKVGKLEGEVGKMEGKVGKMEGKVGKMEGKVGKMRGQLTEKVLRIWLAPTLRPEFTPQLQAWRLPDLSYYYRHEGLLALGVALASDDIAPRKVAQALLDAKVPDRILLSINARLRRRKQEVSHLSNFGLCMPCT